MSEQVAGTAQVNDEPSYTPPTDIFETKDSIIMLMEMPSADPDSLNITVDQGVLTVSARCTRLEPQGYTLAYAEYAQRNYERTFSLPNRIDTEQTEAVFKDGVLRLTLRKAAPQQKKIQVKAA
jgi:HSP20 family molecular chaperone IbpA